MKSQIKITSNISFFPDEDFLVIDIRGNLKAIKLEPKLSRLLLQFLLAPETVQTKEQLISTVWFDNTFIGENALRKSIYKLRFLFKENQIDQYLKIITIPTRGYKLTVSPSKGWNKKLNYTFHPPLRKVALWACCLVLLLFGLLLLKEMTEEEIDIRVSSPSQLSYNETVTAD